MLAQTCTWIEPVASRRVRAKSHDRHHIMMAVEAAAFHADRIRGTRRTTRRGSRELIERRTRDPGVDYREVTDINAIRDEIERTHSSTWQPLLSRRPRPAPLRRPRPPATRPSIRPWSYSGLPDRLAADRVVEDGLPLCGATRRATRCEDDLLAVAALVRTMPSVSRRGRFHYDVLMSFADTLDILYEDNHCLALNKPAGWPTTHFDGTDETVDRLVKAYLKEKYQKPGNVFLGVVHRLDKPT